MEPAPKIIAIFGNTRQQEYLPAVGQLLRTLEAEGFSIDVETEFGRYLDEHGALPAGATLTRQPAESSVMAVSIGGDGTFLRAAEWIGARKIPVMGINTGHLGYLAGFSLDRKEEVIAALHGKYEASERMLIEIKSDEMPAGFGKYALNEVSLSKGDTTSMVSIRARIDGRFIADYLADGLIVATPTGSTAYNLSCGGPILQPTMESLVLTPIAPHSLTLRPLVIGAGATLTLEVHSRGEQCHVGVDGRTFAVTSDGALITVRRADHSLKLAHPAGTDFASVLRGKLGWGA